MGHAPAQPVPLDRGPVFGATSFVFLLRDGSFRVASAQRREARAVRAVMQKAQQLQAQPMC